MDSTIAKALAGKNKIVLANEKDLSSSKPSSFTASFLGVKEVYSLFPGEVLYVGIYKELGTLTILVSDFEIIRYLNISDIQVNKGDQVSTNRYLGVVNNKYGLQLEYCSQWQGSSVMPVRLNNRTFFKQNPLDILNGKYKPDYHKEIERGYTFPDTTKELTVAQQLEFSSDSAIIDKDAKQITSEDEITKAIRDMLSGNS